jgi:hypothetical protein
VSKEHKVLRDGKEVPELMVARDLRASKEFREVLEATEHKELRASKESLAL